jgi:hypothetical protein
MPPGAGGVIHFWCCSGAFLSAQPDPNGICLSRFFSTRGPQNLAVLFLYSALWSPKGLLHDPNSPDAS